MRGKIIKIISEHKSKLQGGRKTSPKLKTGFKRVEATVEEDGYRTTRHVDIRKDADV